MQLWQMDVMGGVALSDGTELKVVTGVDDHSRSARPPASSTAPVSLSAQSDGSERP